MEEIKVSREQDNTPKRPQILTVLCILTFIGSGINFISYLFIALFYTQVTILAESIKNNLKWPGMEMILEGKPLFFAVSALIFAGSGAGALMMWHLKKAGFHVYTIFQILLILSPMYFFHFPTPSPYDLILSSIFVLLYSRNIKNMS
jgi:hypothetical protein